MRNESTNKGNIYRVLINRFERVAPGTAKRLQEEINKKEKEKKFRQYKDIKAKLPDWNFKERMWDMSGGAYAGKTKKIEEKEYTR